MILKLKMKLPYTYEFFVTLASDLVKMDDIKKEIEDSINEFNEKSRTARNIKQIDSHDVKGDLLFVKLSSNNAMGTPTRGLYLLSQLIMNKLKENEKGDLVDKIVKNRSFFKGVGEIKEIKNSVSLNENEDKLNLEKIEAEEVKEKDISIESLFKRIDDLEKRIKKLEKRDYLMNTSKEELDYMYGEMFCNDEDVNEENNEAFDK